MPLSKADQARADELAKRASAAFAESNLAEVRQLYGEVLSSILDGDAAPAVWNVCVHSTSTECFEILTVCGL